MALKGKGWCKRVNMGKIGQIWKMVGKVGLRRTKESKGGKSAFIIHHEG